MYEAKQSGFEVLFKEKEVWIHLYQSDQEETDLDERKTKGVTLILQFKNPQATMKIEARKKQAGTVNFFCGNDQNKWKINIATYEEIAYYDVCPGIDLIFYGKNGRFKYDLVLKPGASVEDICLVYQGADALTLNEEGDLFLHTPYGTLVDEKPICYQMIDGKKCEVEGAYRLDGEEVCFEVGEYEASYSLIIDPILVYSTYLGGGDSDIGYEIAVDDDGNAYVTGYTFSTNFPTTAGAYDESFNGIIDVFISKLNPSGKGLVYSTYLGGTGDDWGIGIAIDQGGNAYVTGYTESANFPTTSGAYDQSFNGSIDVYITKLNPSGTDLVYSTYLGGSDADLGRGIAIDQGGNAYVTGNTTSPNFPTTAGAFQNNLTASNDVFVTIINSIGNALVYSTFLGGSADETGWGIAVDQFGSAYVTGATNSIDFPTTPMAQQTFNAGSDDVFVTKIGLPFQMVQGVTGPTGPRGPRGKDGRFPPNVLPPFRSCCRRRHRFERRSF